MSFDEITKTLRALGQTVADLDGDSSAIAATEDFLRSPAVRKQADVLKAAKKAVKDGLRLPKATEVRAGAAAQSLAALGAILKASGADGKTLKAVSELKSFCTANAAASLEALSEALDDAQKTTKKPEAKPVRAKASAASSAATKAPAKPAAKAGPASIAKTAARTAPKTAARGRSKKPKA